MSSKDASAKTELGVCSYCLSNAHNDCLLGNCSCKVCEENVFFVCYYDLGYDGNTEPKVIFKKIESAKKWCEDNLDINDNHGIFKRLILSQ